MADIIPSEGPPNTLFARLVRYVSAIDPAWESRTRGIDAALLQRYADLSGFGAVDKLPEAFRQTALSIGAEAGGLFQDLRVDADLREVVSLYEDYLKFEPEVINPEFPVVARYIVGDQISLDVRTDPEPPVVDTAGGELIGPKARSWEAFVMRAAILFGEPRRLPHARWYSCAENQMGRVIGDAAAAATRIDEFGGQEGLATAWPSDDYVRIAMGDNASIFAQLGTGSGVLLYAFSDDDEFLRRVSDDLAPAVGCNAGGILRVIRGALGDSPS